MVRRSPQRPRLPLVAGAALLLFALHLAMAPAVPAPAPAIEIRKQRGAGIAAAPAVPQPAAAPAAAPDPAPAAFTLKGVFTEASGGGSAIVALAGGEQRGFRVGEQIAPGVLLAGVRSDGATVAHEGATRFVPLGRGLEALPADGAGAPAGSPQLAQPAPLPPLPAMAPLPDAQKAPPPAGAWMAALQDIGFAPRRNGSAVTGALVQPTSSESARNVGLMRGDVILSVRGRKMDSADAVGSIRRELAARRDVVVQVERGQRVQRLQLRGGGDAGQ